MFSWKSPRLRFPLSVLLFVVTLFCLLLGRTAYLVQQQRDALRLIADIDGHVTFEYEIDSKGIRIPNAEPPGPTWLRNALGEDYFRTPIYVSFVSSQGSNDPQITRDALAAAGRLRSIQSLELSHNKSITDEELALLSGLEEL